MDSNKTFSVFQNVSLRLDNDARRGLKHAEITSNQFETTRVDSRRCIISGRR